MLSFTSIIPGTRKRKILNLPPEILQIVFKYLSVNERKAVRRVCKMWFEICNLPSFSKDELIYCIGCYQLSDIYDILNRSERKLLNLKFKNITFTNDSSFWKTNGSRIRSITFEDCQFDEDIMGKIIYFCEKLFHLAITYEHWHPVNSTRTIHNLASILETRVVRENLQSLELRYSYAQPEDYIFHLFSIFPQLKILKMNFFLKYESVLSFINEYLMASKDRLEVLQLKFRTEGVNLMNKLDCLARILTDMKRLTELSVDCIIESEVENVDTFIYSTPLKSLDIFRKSNRDNESFLMQLLQSNSNLEHFKLRTYDKLVLTKSFIEKLMSSNLKSCYLDVLGMISVQDPDSFSSHVSAEHRPAAFPSLTVSIYNTPPAYQEEAMVAFLRCCPNVHYLRFCYISPNILQSLFKHQKNLRSLTMRDCMERHQIGKYLSISKHVFNQLTDIEHLDLNDLLSYVFLKSLSPEPVLANLKYLKICLSTCTHAQNLELVSKSDLLKLADAAPFLEVLFVQEDKNQNIHFVNLCTELCTKLSHLRYLYWSESGEGPSCADEDYRKLFSICSSLRFLEHGQSGQRNKYFLDTVNNKVITHGVDERRFYIPAAPKIGEFSPDCIFY